VNDQSELFARTRAFTRAMDDALASRAIPHPLGTVIVNDDYPASYSMNFLRIEGPQPGLTVEAVEAAVTAAMDLIGRTHLQAVVEDGDAGAGLAVPLRERGWEATELVTMAWLAEPRRDPPVRAAVVPWEVLRPAVLAHWRGDPSVGDEEVARQLTDRRAALARGTHLRHLAAPAPPEVAGAFADLYSDGRTAQVESVNTLEAHRNQGLASAMVLHAARLARDEGHDLVFLVADVEDWPRHLYERLGFEEIGRWWELSKDR
jgi:ribosomal protein S18 acetylase RimI-like enzyme